MFFGKKSGRGSFADDKCSTFLLLKSLLGTVQFSVTMSDVVVDGGFCWWLILLVSIIALGS